MLRGISRFFHHSLRHKLKKENKRNIKNHRNPFSSDQIQCTVRLLDESDSIISMPKNSLGCDLINQVLIKLDLAERDYFSLIYFDSKMNICWVEPSKKLKRQLNGHNSGEFFFRVKFYTLDPDQLNEELTRYHYFLQLKDDIYKERLKPSFHMCIQLAAYSVQAEIGDYDPDIHKNNYVSEMKFLHDQNDDFELLVIEKHRELIGLTPSQCEINFLKLIKYHDLYGVERHTIKSDHGGMFDIGIAPRGILILESERKLNFFPWSLINIIGFKKKFVFVYVYNRLNKKAIDKHSFSSFSTKQAKIIWKSAVEHHSFFRLFRIRKSLPDKSNKGAFFTSKFRYSGRTLYEATRDVSKLSRKSMNVKRTKSENYTQRQTIGYIRIGSRVFVQAENGEYFRGKVIGLSDKVYVRCDDGVTIAHAKNSLDSIIFDSNPDPSEVTVGSRVIAQWPGINTYLPGKVDKIEGNGVCSRYSIAFDDGDRHWNNIDQIRLHKPPMYFGPGSNTTYLQKKYSMVKTTALVNAQVAKKMSDNPDNSRQSIILKDLVNSSVNDEKESNALTEIPFR